MLSEAVVLLAATHGLLAIRQQATQAAIRPVSTLPSTKHLMVILQSPKYSAEWWYYLPGLLTPSLSKSLYGSQRQTLSG